MSYRRIRQTAVRRAGARGARALVSGCVLAALGLAAGPAPGALAVPAPMSGAAPDASAVPVAPETTAHTVTLVTGERVTLRADGSVVVAPRPGAEADYVTRRLDNDVFVIPLTALPYLGRTLDPALFNVSALAEAGVTTTPVRVEAAEGATAPPSGPAFGAALARQISAEAAKGSVGEGPLFGGVSSVAPAVAADGLREAPRPSARADHTVKVTVLGTDGEPLPGTTSFALANADDAALYQEPFLDAVDGETRVEVPAGHYTAMVSAPAFDSAGEPAGVRMATAEFTVPDSGTGTEAVLDLRKATERVTFSTPRPAEDHQLILHYLRQDAKGAVAVNGGVGVSGGSPVQVQPSGRPVTTGDLRFNVYTHRKAPADAATPYSYDLKLANPAGTIAKNQHYKVTARQLATVRTNYHSDTPGRAQEVARLMYLPYETSGEALSEPFKTPARRTEYVGGSAGASYTDWLKAGERRFVSQEQPLVPGRTTTVDWLRGPLVPGFTEPARGAAADATWYCSACRKGDALTFSLGTATVTDSAGHHVLAVPSDITSSHFAVVSGDTTLYEGDGVPGGVLTVPPEQAPYTVVYDQTRTNGEFRQSLTTHTEWTFASGHSGGQTVPDNWTCVSEAGEYEGPAECSALPVVVPHYRLDAGLDGTSPAGDGRLVVGFGHVPGVVAPPAVTKARVEVSFDDGERWTAASITALGKGRFRADWTIPDSAAGRDASLRVTGTDAGGNAVTQTVKSAFTVAASES